jgi:heat shock protein beta
VYLPDTLPNDFYSKDYVGLESLKLFVRRVFITGDLGKDYLPKHLNWVKVFVDVDDLPLNVGRDRLQKTRALGQIKSNLQKRVSESGCLAHPRSPSSPSSGLQILDLFAQVAEKDTDKYNDLYQKAGTALKVGIVEDVKNRERILKLLRFETTTSSNLTSLSEVVSRRKTGQTQLFYLAGAGMKKEDLERSPYIERIVARGYECVYFMDPMDEMLVSTVPTFEGLRFQDVAKEGLTFGDEDEDAEEEAQLKSQFEPLAKYLQKQLAESIDKVVVSTRLTNSPCVVTVGKHGHSANMERLVSET